MEKPAITVCLIRAARTLDFHLTSFIPVILDSLERFQCVELCIERPGSDHDRVSPRRNRRETFGFRQ